MMTPEEKEEIALIIQSTVKQMGHLQSAPETVNRLKAQDSILDQQNKQLTRIEKMTEANQKELRKHADAENGILESIHKTMEHIMSDQDMKHNVIEGQLAELKPLRDGLIAASTVKRTILWISGFIAGIAIMVASWKEFFRH